MTSLVEKADLLVGVYLLRIPKTKLAFFFELTDNGDLQPLPGGCGQFIFYSPTDYDVDPPRQIDHGAT